MQKDPFLVLGLDRDKANQNDVYEAYIKLKYKYSDELLKEGEVGAQAAKKLSEIEQAYSDCKEELEKRNTISDFGGDFGDIGSLINQNRIDEAQRRLDDVSERNAEWHYLQSVIYYKKGWYLESRKQLKFALNLDPSNEKYKTASEKLEHVINGTTGRPADGQATQDTAGRRRSYEDPVGNPNMNTTSVCNCCSNLICLDCCCECMGGDLIPCC
ncbi:MAG: hypothetical protein ACI4S9_01745 [Christensenellales bacterium]